MPQARSRRGAGGLLTILFTDLESSTAVTQRMGDARAQEIVRAHNQIVRREIAQRGGSEIKHTGDGIMVTFPSAARAIACAIAIQDAVGGYAIDHPEAAFRVSIGLNAGEPLAEDADVFGTAVQLAARTCAEASGGQILATNVVRELVVGKGVLFRDAGSAQMKGFEEPVRLFEVSPGEAGIEEGDASPVRLWRRPLVWGTGVVIALVSAGALAGVYALGAGDDATPGTTYETYRFHYESEIPVEITAGDCETEDFVVSGQGVNGPVTGDLTGTVDVDFEARLPAASQCSTLTSFEDAVYTVTGGKLMQHSISISRHRLGASPLVGSTTEAVTVGALIGGEGSFEGVVGKLRCLSSGLSRTGDEGPIAISRADCELQLAESAGALPLAVEAVSNTNEISSDRGSQDVPNAAWIAVAFANSTDSTVRDITLRIAQPPGANIAVRETLNDGWSEGSHVFRLPDLAAGEIADFRFYVRLIEADSNSISLEPEISADGIDFTDRSEPIVLSVVN